MDLNILAKDIELQIVNNEHGWGVVISFTSRRTNQNFSDIKAFFQEGHLSKDADEGSYSVERDEAVFYSVDLDIRPEKGDKITTADGQFWYVNYLTGTNPYDIFCTTNESHARGRSGRRDR